MERSLFIEYQALLEEQKELQKKISQTTHGYLSKKSIRGKTYWYLQARKEGRVMSQYIPEEQVEALAASIEERKKYENELAALALQIQAIEELAQNKADTRSLMRMKLTAGMDSLDEEQRGKSASFADAMNAIEGVPASSATAKAVADWKLGKAPYYKIFEETLKRYGFLAEVQ